MKIFCGGSNKPLAETIAASLGSKLSALELFVFPDGEKRVRVEENVVDEDCIVIQSTTTPVDQNYMELFFIIDALKRSGARKITAVVPYFGYQRQDHVFRDGEVVSLEVMIGFLESLKVDRVVTVDLHSIKIPELFHIPVTHLSALPVFADAIKRELKEDAVLVSPDLGGLRGISKLSELLGNLAWVSIVKKRNLETGEIKMTGIEGDTSKLKKRAIILDDMISSGKTIVQAAAFLKKMGVEECHVFATHAIFSKEAPYLLQHSIVDRVFVTDSVLVPEEKKFPKLTILSVADIIAKELK